MCVTLDPLSLSQGVSNGQKREVIRCNEVMTGQLTQERKRQIEGEIKRGRDVGHFPIVSESLLWKKQADTARTDTHTSPHMLLDRQAACVRVYIRPLTFVSLSLSMCVHACVLGGACAALTA